jgi:GT2 family glycosyltransferase
MEIGVVIVTYNRLSKLKHALNLFEKQIHLPKYIIIVDNKSTDGTAEFLDKWEKSIDSLFNVEIIHTKCNCGGSGGFYIGLKAAMLFDVEWIWVSDDDAYPEIDALKNASDYIENSNRPIHEISAICGSVINSGKFDLSHRRIYSKNLLSVKSEVIPEKKYLESDFIINSFSYVGAIINKEKMKKVGVTNRDFFIWCDDTEHSLRLNSVGRIICVPNIRVHHDVKKEEGEINWRSYYGIRNTLVMYKLHFPKSCYCYEIVKKYLKLALFYILPFYITHIDKKYTNLYRRAIHDAIFNNLGINNLYMPGWKP